MMREPFRGVFSIPVTPFSDDLSVDYKAFRGIISYLLEVGVNGIVLAGNIAELDQLTFEERQELTRIAIEICNEKVPVVVGVTDASVRSAMLHAKNAQNLGASAVVAMTPFIGPLTVDEIFGYFKSIDSAINIPLIVQSLFDSAGVMLPQQLMQRLLIELPNVQYVLEESRFTLQGISQLVKMKENSQEGVISGVMSGRQGLHLVEDHGRGACGNIAGGALSPVLSFVWKLLDDKKTDIAQESLKRALWLMYYGRCYPVIMEKEIYRRRGLMNNTLMRLSHDASFDRINERELDWMIDACADLLKI